MPRRQRSLTRIAAVAALAACGAHAQGQDQGGAAAAINEAVQQGTTPYRPDPAATPASIQSDECRALAEQIAQAPKREYRATAPAIETAQGRMVPELERERPKQSLQQAYREKCTQ
ncbi:hypothetical protein VSR17_00525 [Cupriavidus taiwanensis]|uniref:Putative lipoprotein n=1 Tax=Cupriavidus taiwanensis TaxID=164546 RepID=A0A375GTH1_9BURK|nr:hypothetical protein [Cupriavidus taiwanensis]SOY54310.1 putative lipoprotein [Cupriavidus taiwanensis]SOY55167.1 putative lipoprotein [Cupriavidus taiwanensis]SOY89171.1 putative lipoprotein [Cupriavidus taiwanensis]SOZ24812.1 putative lipoprotein [Cupriavidus taiwanensis]SOZ61426.1 putative lipoprotein [Cupriavidus taiwanensis]